ncbi:hypothetical protein [Raoultibacter phocaeensis]|uniref:hypothetical protein n=1 Tax=Raoultibacter phocaeensis TaxID=2479841 RepID=UPI00111A3940|nr:hypothetical protein [Raoultibacter phocaeensis]
MSEERHTYEPSVHEPHYQTEGDDRAIGAELEADGFFVSLDGFPSQSDEEEAPSRQDQPFEIQDALAADFVVLSVAEAEEERTEATVSPMPELSFFQEIGASVEMGIDNGESDSEEEAYAFDPFFAAPPENSKSGAEGKQIAAAMAMSEAQSPDEKREIKSADEFFVADVGQAAKSAEETRVADDEQGAESVEEARVTDKKQEAKSAGSILTASEQQEPQSASNIRVGEEAQEDAKTEPSAKAPVKGRYAEVPVTKPAGEPADAAAKQSQGSKGKLLEESDAGMSEESATTQSEKRRTGPDQKALNERREAGKQKPVATRVDDTAAKPATAHADDATPKPAAARADVATPKPATAQADDATPNPAIARGGKAASEPAPARADDATSKPTTARGSESERKQAAEQTIPAASADARKAKPVAAQPQPDDKAAIQSEGKASSQSETAHGASAAASDVLGQTQTNEAGRTPDGAKEPERNDTAPAEKPSVQSAAAKASKPNDAGQTKKEDGAKEAPKASSPASVDQASAQPEDTGKNPPAIANHPMPNTAPVPVRPAIEQEERKDKKAVKKAAGTALVIIALALACVACAAVMLSMGSNQAQEEKPSQAETGQAADEGAAGSADAGTETYRYSVAGPDGAMCQATEEAQFDEQGILEKSVITVELASPEQAEEFLETTKLDFGDAFLDGSVEGATTVVEVKATAEDMTREAYAAVLKKNASDFEII